MPILYSYFRSSCSYRIRIALELKNIACDYVYINLHPELSEQHEEKYLAINPHGKVPFWVDGDVRIGQSMAILAYLDEAYPAVPLLPSDTKVKAEISEFCQTIACDIQPLNNIAVLEKLRKGFGLTKDQRSTWYDHWIQQGFHTLEARLEARERTQFCYGEQPSLADLMLVPQVWNANRFNVALSAFPRIKEIYQNCQKHDAFIAASPEKQDDFVS